MYKVIENIKNGLLNLSQSEFQELCNSYLYRKGYSNIVSLGGQPGKRKTTKGTPDTYIMTEEGKYIFVEYTTQQNNLFSKIKEDLDKCLDEDYTKIPHDKITRIIYCHNTSKLNPEQNEKLKSVCLKKGIELKIIGIDELSEEIYWNHRTIAKEHLNISWETGQILEVDDFIKDYNSNKLTSKIDTKFLFREEEIKKIDNAFEKADIVILKGASGNGKTRLALHYIENHLKNKNSEIYCIRNKNLRLYKDLKLFLDKKGDYVVFIDDANQLTELEHIIRYTTDFYEGYNVKIIITVRDYAFKKVVNDIFEISNYEVVEVERLKDEEIEKLIESEFNIFNYEYKKRIINIAKGNIRIAFMAAEVACKTNKLSFINETIDLYDEYFKSYLLENEIINNKELMVTAGMVSFFDAIRLDDSYLINKIIGTIGIDEKNFIENINILHEREILDIYANKAVKFSDQCLSNYFLKLIFVDKKFIKISDMIKIYFPLNKSKVIFAINTILNVFRKKEIQEYIIKEIQEIWNEWEKEKSTYFYEFFKQFYQVNPIKTLKITKYMIDKEETKLIDPKEMNWENGKNNLSVYNDIINILGSFYYSEHLEIALDLYFKYYLKRPDLYMEFYNGINMYFNIKKESEGMGYYTQMKLLKKFKEYSDNWKNKYITKLFLAISIELLKIEFRGFETINFIKGTSYELKLGASEKLFEYRKLIWEYLIEISNQNIYEVDIKAILDWYTFLIKKENQEIIKFDFKYIKNIEKNIFKVNNLQDCIIIQSLNNKFLKIEFNIIKEFEKYIKNEKLEIYNILLSKDIEYNPNYNHDKSLELKNNKIKEFLSNNTLIKIEKIIDISCEIENSISSIDRYLLKESIGIVSSIVSDDRDKFIYFIEYYMEKNSPMNLNTCNLIKILFKYMNKLEIFDLINCKCSMNKMEWIYAYYCELPKEKITKDDLDGLYKFIEMDCNSIPYYISIDLMFLEKYCHLDKDIFIRVSNIILKKKNKIGYNYFSLLFYEKNIEKTIEIFSENMDLLIRIYIFTLSKYNTFLFDYKGESLIKIYEKNERILDEYLKYIIEENKSTSKEYDDNIERLNIFWSSKNYNKIFNKIFDYFASNIEHEFIFGFKFFNKIMIPIDDIEDIEERHIDWINQYIDKYYSKQDKMKYLFYGIVEFDYGKIKIAVERFYKNNKSISYFKKLQITPNTYSGSPSFIPAYEKCLNHLKSLKTIFNGIEGLEHLEYIDERINFIEKMIENELVDEFLKENRIY